MNRRTRLIVLTVAAVAVILTAAVYGWSQSGPTCPMKSGMDKPCPFMPVTGTAKHMFGPRPSELKKELNLTAEQEKKLTAAFEQFKVDNASTFAELKTKRAEFHKMLLSGSPSKAQVASKIDEITALQGKLMLDAAGRVLDAKSILTAAQLKIVAEEAPKLMSMGKGGHCGMMGGDSAGTGCQMGAGCKMMGGTQSPAKMTAPPTKATDPACGMTINTKDTAGKSQYKGRTYYFCSTACKSKFDKNPGQYTK